MEKASATVPSCLTWESALVTNLRLLGFPSTEVALSRDLFQRPNKRAFQTVVLFLFDALDKMETARRFDHCRRCLTRRHELDFAKVTCAWLAELSGEGRLPRVTPSLVAAPQGEKVYEVLTKLSSVVLRRRMVSDLGVSPRDLLCRPSLPPSLPHGPLWRATAARSLLSGIAAERSQLLARLARLSPADAARRDVIAGLEARHRRAGVELRAIEAELADLRAGGDVTRPDDVTPLDEGRLQRLEALWRQLRGRVERLTPAMNSVAALLQDGGAAGAARLDGATLAPAAVPSEAGDGGRPRGGRSEVSHGGRLDLEALLGAVRVAASRLEAAGGAESGRRREDSAAVEGAAKDCLACLQGQVSELQGLVDRAGTSLPARQASISELRARRHLPRARPSPPGDSHFSLPAINGLIATPPAAATPKGGAASVPASRYSLGPPPATPPLPSNGWSLAPLSPASSVGVDSTTAAAVAAVDASTDAADDIEAMLERMSRRLRSARRLPSSNSSTPRAVSSASVTRDGDHHHVPLTRAAKAQRPPPLRSSLSPPSTSSDGAYLSSLNEEPSAKELSSRFRLSLDRLGLGSSEEEEEEEEGGEGEEVAVSSEDVALAEPNVDGEFGSSDAEIHDLVMETSSILLDSSHGDEESMELDSLAST